MTKIAFIGGGSLQWTPGLVADMAQTEALAGAQLVLYDTNAESLNLMTPVARRIVAHVGGTLGVTATLDRHAALRDADFVILCIAVGGLPAMRNDLLIPAEYGIYQSVGDTVGPGGLARGLRHIPFALQLAREMEQLCPHAWLLNLTNPMTTICRAVTKATTIRTVGLCHEVTHVRKTLAGYMGVAVDGLPMEIGGINHLPAILRWQVDGRDGSEELRAWLDREGVFGHAVDVRRGADGDPFHDRWAVKLALFDQTGVLFGAGDRHVAEFFSGFLTEDNGWGREYGVLLTTIEDRERLAADRQNLLAAYTPRRSDEQLTLLMAALLGGPSARLIVNVPNIGQIDNLPRQAVVECIAQIDRLGVHPLAVGTLPPAAHAAIAPHVDRQELIVSAGASGQRQPALQALSTDPLVRSVGDAAPLLDRLLAANEPWVAASLSGPRATGKLVAAWSTVPGV